MNRVAAARYIAEIATELTRIAQAARLNDLATILRMAVQEAAGVRPPETG